MKKDRRRFFEKLRTMNGTELRVAYLKLFEERPHSHRHEWLRNRIAWGFQAKLETGMSQRFIQYGLQNADLSELRTHPPRSTAGGPEAGDEISTGESQSVAEKVPGRDPRIPPPGTVLSRDYKGTRIAVKVLAHGFEWNGTVYSSFTKAVKTATGASYSPYVFFKLGAKS